MSVCGTRAVIENPLADRDLPHGVGIVQKPVAEHDQQHIDVEADPHRKWPARGASVVEGMGDGQGHGRDDGLALGSSAFRARSNHVSA